MRKVLSIVLALLMVSMMIPSMAFADSELVTGAPTAALVATESFTLTATSEVTVKVNANVFDIGGEVDGKIESKTFAAGEITITVEDAIPAEAFTSTIRIEAGDAKQDIVINIDDRIVGDVTNDGVIDLADAAQVISKFYGQDVGTTFSSKVANVSNDTVIDLADAAQIISKFYGQDVSNANIGVNYYSGAAVGEEIAKTEEFENPDYDATVEPPVTTVELPAVEKVTAVVSGETIYYDFTAVAGATGYQISVNGTVVAENTTDLTGSFAAPEGFKADGTDTIAVVALGDNTTTTNSPAKDATITVAAPSTALADWLKANGLEDVVITVYEITAE